MSAVTLLALSSCSTVVTCVELSYRNQRHPFGDRHFKALLWWVTLVAIDAGIGIAILFGVVAVKLGNWPNNSLASGIWLGILIGILGPLGLRSPVKNSNVGNKRAEVGITYVYDLIRLNALFALDERFVRLRRRDVALRREHWKSLGICIDDIVNEFNRHLDDHVRMSTDHREQIREKIRIALTVPDEDTQMNGLIKLMKAERLNSLIDEFDCRVIPNSGNIVTKGQMAKATR